MEVLANLHARDQMGGVLDGALVVGVHAADALLR